MARPAARVSDGIGGRASRRSGSRAPGGASPVAAGRCTQPPYGWPASELLDPYPRAMPVLPRFRERLVLGHVRRGLSDGEQVVAWTHANVPDTRAPGLLVVTDERCLLHVASSSIEDISTPLTELSSFKLDRRNPELVRVRLCVGVDEVAVELSLTDRVRSRSVGRVLSALTRAKVAAPDSFNAGLTSPLPPMERRVRHHARRVWITVLGVLVLMVSAVFASPFVPGPGALTAVAGIAILAREYEWARDLHVWAARQADRFMNWMRGLRQRRREARNARRTVRSSTRAIHSSARRAATTNGSGPRVLEATVPVSGNERSDGDRGRGAVAS